MKTVCSIGLITLLLFQLTTLHWSLPNFSYQNETFGDISIRDAVTKNMFISSAIKAEYAVKKNETYDSITFVGDVLLARNVEHIANANGWKHVFSGLSLDAFSSKSALVGNFEATIPTKHIPTPTGNIRFSVPGSALPPFRDAGFTHVSLANNHSNDYGEEAHLNTLKQLSENRITAFGNQNILTSDSISYVTVNDINVALIGIHFLLDYSDENIVEVFKEAKKRSTLQIAYVHWGEEYALRQSNEQRNKAKRLIDAGADLIIGHHPHVVQGIEIVDSVPVVYSLGNYLFDQYFSKDVQEGLVLNITFEPGIQISLIPVTSQNQLSQPQPMTPVEHQVFLDALAKKSDGSLQQAIISGFIQTTDLVATSSKMAIINQ